MIRARMSFMACSSRHAKSITTPNGPAVAQAHSVPGMVAACSSTRRNGPFTRMHAVTRTRLPMRAGLGSVRIFTMPSASRRRKRSAALVAEMPLASASSAKLARPFTCNVRSSDRSTSSIGAPRRCSWASPLACSASVECADSGAKYSSTGQITRSSMFASLPKICSTKSIRCRSSRSTAYITMSNAPKAEPHQCTWRSFARRSAVEAGSPLQCSSSTVRMCRPSNAAGTMPRMRTEPSSTSRAMRRLTLASDSPDRCAMSRPLMRPSSRSRSMIL